MGSSLELEKGILRRFGRLASADGLDSFELVERVPFSELEEVSITVEEYRPDRDGLIRIPITLAPREIAFDYCIEMHAKMELSG